MSCLLQALTSDQSYGLLIQLELLKTIVMSLSICMDVTGGPQVNADGVPATPAITLARERRAHVGMVFQVGSDAWLACVNMCHAGHTITRHLSAEVDKFRAVMRSHALM